MVLKSPIPGPPVVQRIALVLVGVYGGVARHEIRAASLEIQEHIGGTLAGVEIPAVRAVLRIGAGQV